MWILEICLLFQYSKPRTQKENREKKCMGLCSENHISILKHNVQTITSHKSIAETMGNILASVSSSDS